jgi:peptide/nickel transport system substrate-binding protein
MKNKTIWLILSCLMVLSMVMVSCSTKTTPTTTTSITTKPTTSPITSPTTKPTSTPTTSISTTSTGSPQYGGAFTLRMSGDPQGFDPYFTTTVTVTNLYMETLTSRSTLVDPKNWTIKVSNPENTVGCLAEGWEQPDLSTLIFHIRKGVRWQDKAPMNGREFTAYDVEYHYQRQYGLGTGFTKTPYIGLGSALLALESITATDKYTVVFKVKTPSLQFLYEGVDPLYMFGTIVAPEVVKQYGNAQDWKNAVGTGPFILNDYVSGSSLAYSKNPNYWGYDERYPQNKLPYVDDLRILIIPDPATALSALRTGKIDLIEGLNWEQAASLKKTSPELLQVNRPVLRPAALGMRVDLKPFNDIRVRRAMQMAMNLKEMAATRYGGNSDGTPVGLIGSVMEGFYMPYSEWESEVKSWYAYNPEGAKKLLAEAGYPSGFKTNMVLSTAAETGRGFDSDLAQIIKAYLLDIGIDVEIRPMDNLTYTSYTKAMKHDGLIPTLCSVGLSATVAIQYRYTKHSYNTFGISDPVYDDLVNKANAATTINEFKSIVKQADYYSIKQQWVVNLQPMVEYCIYQPWFKGNYVGQIELRGWELSRWWVDDKLKKSMGR